jgi:tetratricopeptide (TPR) repeat protein
VLACGSHLAVTRTSEHARSGTREPARPGAPLHGRVPGQAARWCALLVLPVALGCSGFSRRWQPDDVVFARQIAQRGMDAVDAGNWQRAEEFFAKAVEVCPVDERVQSRYADALWHRGSRQEALEHMKEAVRLSGGEPELVVRLGEMHLETGDFQQASQLAERVILSGRQLASAYRLRGDVRDRQGKSDEALADYHRALGMQSQYPEVQMAIAAVYYRQGRPQRALSTLQALAGSYPSGEEPAEMLHWQGLACKALGRHEQAVVHLAQAEGRGLQSADLLYSLAEARYLAGDPAAAQLTLQRAMELEPTHPDAQRLAASIQQPPHVASRRE